MEEEELGAEVIHNITVRRSGAMPSRSGQTVPTTRVYISSALPGCQRVYVVFSCTLSNSAPYRCGMLNTFLRSLLK